MQTFCKSTLKLGGTGAGCRSFRIEGSVLLAKALAHELATFMTSTDYHVVDNILLRVVMTVVTTAMTKGQDSGDDGNDERQVGRTITAMVQMTAAGQTKAPSCTGLNQTSAGGAFVWPGCIFGAFSYMFFWLSLHVEVSEVSFEVLEVRFPCISRCPRCIRVGGL